MLEVRAAVVMNESSCEIQPQSAEDASSVARKPKSADCGFHIHNPARFNRTNHPGVNKGMPLGRGGMPKRRIKGCRWCLT